jgi:hypothetical protein
MIKHETHNGDIHSPDNKGMSFSEHFQVGVPE